MRLKIVTPERVVLDTDSVEAVYVAAVDGEVGILSQHIPLVTPLAPGVLRYVKQGTASPAAVMGGLLRTDGETVAIVTDAAELSSEIDVLRAEEAKKRAESRLHEKQGDLDLTRVQLSLSRAAARLKASRYTPH